MSKLKALIHFLLLYVATTFPIITYREFKYESDLNHIESILAKEWTKLFLLPTYDKKIVHSMFHQRRPGDTSVPYAILNIDVVYENETLVGFVTYYTKKGNIGHIELLAVDSEYRNRGYGKLLIENVTQKFKATCCDYLQLFVYTSNPRAIEFYRHLGFSIKYNWGTYLLLSKSLQ